MKKRNLLVPRPSRSAHKLVKSPSAHKFVTIFAALLIVLTVFFFLSGVESTGEIVGVDKILSVLKSRGSPSGGSGSGGGTGIERALPPTCVENDDAFFSWYNRPPTGSDTYKKLPKACREKYGDKYIAAPNPGGKPCSNCWPSSSPSVTTPCKSRNQWVQACCTVNGKRRCATGYVADACPSCKNCNQFDLSKSLFSDITGGNPGLGICKDGEINPIEPPPECRY